MMGRGRRARRRGAAPGRGARGWGWPGPRGRASGPALAAGQEPWLRRQARGLRPDRNPLRRRIDRVETYLLAGLFVAAAAGAPLAAQAASAASYASALRVQREQLATEFRVTAALTQAAGSPVNGYTLSVDVPARASWTSVSGVRRSGEILATAGSARGTRVTLWTDRDGYLVSPPMTAAQVAGQGDAGAIGAVAVVVALYITGTGAARYVLRRRRLAAWEADWLLTAPTWNRQSW